VSGGNIASLANRLPKSMSDCNELPQTRIVPPCQSKKCCPSVCVSRRPQRVIVTTSIADKSFQRDNGDISSPTERALRMTSDCGGTGMSRGCKKAYTEIAQTNPEVG